MLLCTHVGAYLGLPRLVLLRAGLDPAELPLISEAARTGAGTDDHQRFRFAVDALITGFAAVLTG